MPLDRRETDRAAHSMEAPMAAYPVPTAEDVAEVFANLTLFCELLEIRTKHEGIVTFGYDRWHYEQRAFQKNRSGRDIVLKSRQIGFSTLELARDLQYARTHEGVQVVVVVHFGESKDELFAGVKIMAEALCRVGAAPKPLYSTKTELRWADNNSVIKIVEAGNTEVAGKKRGRSGTIHRIHFTEVAYYLAAEATIDAMMDALSPSGEVVFESTADGTGNAFHQKVMLANEGKGREKLHFYPWFAHEEHHAEPQPDLYSRAYPEDEQLWIDRYIELGLEDSQIQWWVNKVDEKRATGGLADVLKEFPPTLLDAFSRSDGQWIPANACDVLAMRVVEPIRIHRLVTDTGRDLGELRIYEEPQPNQGYIAAADVAEGIGKDESTITVGHHRTGDVVAVFSSDGIEPGDHGLALALAGRLYNNALVAPERNNNGAATLRALETEAKYGNVYVHEDGRRGWPTTPATRPILFDDLRTAIIESAKAVQDGGSAKLAHTWTPDAQTVSQCSTLVRGKDGKPAARGKGSKGGAKDDLFVSWAIFRQVRARVSIPSTRELPRVPNRSRAAARKLSSIL
jgi:hypothetical protein